MGNGMKSNGFTLVELMITLVISSIIIALIYTAYTVQQKTAAVQEQVVEMQQNIRAAMDLITRDIRMAAYDPDNSCNAAITTATGTQLSIEICADDDGEDNDNDSTVDEPGEQVAIAFDLYDAYDDGRQDLGRTVGATKRAIAENIDAVEFYYTLEDGTQSANPALDDLEDIRTVTISILARAGQSDSKFFNSREYVPASGTPWDLNGGSAGNAPNDNFRRRLLITSVQCRNLGLD